MLLTRRCVLLVARFLRGGQLEDDPLPDVGSLSGILSNEDMLRMKITPYPLSREGVVPNAQRAGGPSSSI